MKLQLLHNGFSLRLTPETDDDLAQIAALFGLPGADDGRGNISFTKTLETGKAIYSVDGSVEVLVADAWWNNPNAEE
jgi:hypothetical protein